MPFDAAVLAERALRLRDLHHGPDLLVFPNAWDVASAKAVEAAGFPAVATSSGAVALCLGYPDNDTMPVDEAFGMIARIGRALSVPLTADIEAGYGLAPDALAERLLEAGAVGCNLEDTDHHGDTGFVPADDQAERIAALVAAGRSSGVEIAVNARVDLFLRTRPEDHAGVMDDAIDRGRRYLAAGATSVYPIVLADPALIRTYVDAVEGPVNIIVREGSPSLAELRALGVARASLAGGVYRGLLGQLKTRLEAIAAEAAG